MCYPGVQMVYPSMVKAKDPVTNNIVLQILTDGIEYEDDLQAVIKDIGLLQSKWVLFNK
jgi:ferritin-like protein